MTATSPPAGPLSGITVVDLTRVLAGPYCTMMLAEFGARVIKVEPPQGDDSRHFGPHVQGKSAYFVSLNRGKESIVLDLKAAADRAIFERLLARADVLVENYRGGTLMKLGYGWETLHQRYPRLIYAAVSGFGHTGPYADRPAYDMVAQGMGGIMSLTGHPGAPPTRVGTSIGDITAGTFALSGILAALYDRTRTGKGRKVDVAMLDSQVAILENAIVRYTATGEIPGPMGARHPSIAPFDAFQTADHPIIIAAGNDILFRRLCETIGRPELAQDPRYCTNAGRVQAEAELKRAIEAALAADTAAMWLRRFLAAGIPSGPINTVADVVNDPHVSARNMIVTVTDDAAGSLRVAGNPVKLSGMEDPPDRPPAPELDQHRDKILSELENG